MVFHEITRPAIQAGGGQPARASTSRLVDAQEARRILDRLYGYEVSPVLWKKVMPKARRPAGCSRWRPASWSSGSASGCVPLGGVLGHPRDAGAIATLRPSGEGPRTFPATLIALDGDRIATGKDFDPTTGQVRPGAGVVHLDGDGARGLAARLEGRPFEVIRVEEKPYRRRPYAPFITSTLQQEAARKLRYSSAQTMRTAQRLYENGYITYMRTDSVNLSETALAAARRQIAELYGDRIVPPQPRRTPAR